MIQIIKSAARLLALLIFVAAFPAFSTAQQPVKAKPKSTVTAGKGKQNTDKNAARRFDREKFNRELQTYVTENAGLTAAECRRFFPVFFEYKTKVHNLERQKGRSLRGACESRFNERDCQRVLDEAANLDTKISRLEADYNRRFVSLIGSVKTVKVIHADRRFSRKLFKKMTRK